MRRTLIMFIFILTITLQTTPLSFDATAGTDIAKAPLSAAPGLDEPGSTRQTPLPIVLNTSVERYIYFFTGRGRVTYQEWLDRSVRYLPMITNLLKEQNLPPDLLYIAMIESGFDASAVSRAKAAGPWQLMSDTARHYGLRVDRWIDERRDFAKSTLAAARYIRDLHDQYASWPLVLAAYNAGAGTIDQAMRKTGSDDFWDLRQTRFLRRETKGFVPKFMAAALIARSPASYGFHLPDSAPLRYDEVAIRAGMNLRLAAYCAGSTLEKLKTLNPELLGNITPPGAPEYVLKIPAGTKRRFLARSTAIRKTALMIAQEGKVSVFLHGPAASVDAAGDNPSSCSIFDKRISLLAHRRSRTIDIFPVLDGHSLTHLAEGGREKTGNVTFCVKQTNESVVLHTSDLLWSSSLPGSAPPVRVTIQ